MVEEVALRVVVDGLRLRGGAFVPEGPRAAVVLLHGIPAAGPPDPDDPGYREFARRLADNGFVTGWADMRAARESPGYFSIEGWVRDAAGIVEAVRALTAAAELPLAIVGSSAGGAVAVEVVSRGAHADALVLLAAPAAWVSFASDVRAGLRRITEDAGMAVSQSVVDSPEAWAAEFDGVVTENAIAQVRAPILIVHGEDDDVVPVDHARRLSVRAPGSDLHIIRGAGHRLRLDPPVVAVVVDWLEEHLK